MYATYIYKESGAAQTGDSEDHVSYIDLHNEAGSALTCDSKDRIIVSMCAPDMIPRTTSECYTCFTS